MLIIDNDDYKIKRNEILKGVLKTCKYALTLMEKDVLSELEEDKENKYEEDEVDEVDEKNRNLHKMVYNHILCELGVDINTYGYVQEVLRTIVSEYDKRCKYIKEYDLEQLDQKLFRLDRNKDENIRDIIKFIYDKYGINIDISMLCPSKTRHEIIDYMMDIL